MSAGLVIRDYLEDHDIRHKDLAATLALSPRTLSGYLTGNRAMPEEILVKISTSLHISTDFIHGLTDEPRPPLSLSGGEYDLLSGFRSLNPQQKELVLQIILLLHGQNVRK